MTRRAYNEAEIVLSYTVKVSDRALDKYGTAARAVSAAIGDMDALREEMVRDVVEREASFFGFSIGAISLEVKK